MKEELAKKERSNSVPADLQAEVDALANLTDDQIQTDDIPEVRDWSNAERRVFYQPVQRQERSKKADFEN